MKQRKVQTVLTLATALLFLAAGPAIAKKPVPPPLGTQVQLPGNKIPQFVDPLPVLDLNPQSTTGIATLVAGPGEIVLNMLEFKANIMPSTFVPATGAYTGTWTFGYLVNQPNAPGNAVETPVGPVIVATRGTPTQIRYVNDLTANNIHWRDWIDKSLHSAFHQAEGVEMPIPNDTSRYLGPVLAVPHLHGGEVPAVIDGGPEAWFANINDIDVNSTSIPYSQGKAYYGGTDVAGDNANPADFNEAIYRYPNTQEAAPLWFHDHLLGGTRINATFAGLAGAYAIIDPELVLPAGLGPIGLQNPDGSGGRLLVPLVIQDRMFDTYGQLFFPKVGVNPEHPYWVPEFVGDTIIVNGKVWPFLSVDRQRYRFFLINGSNSRGYDMFLQDPASGIKGPPMWVIATDGGYLDAPVKIDPNATGQQKKAGLQQSLMMMPGERYEIIVDFGDPVWFAAINAAYRGAVPPLNLLLQNTAPTVLGNPKASLDGRIMQFRVSANAPADASYNPAIFTLLRPPMVRLADPVTGTVNPVFTNYKTRELTLNEVGGAGGPLEALVNNSKWSGLRPESPGHIEGSLINGNWNSELPNEGETEVWEIVNLTADSHPIHLHAVQYQILNRQAFDAAGFTAAYDALFPTGVFTPGYGPPLSYAPSGASGNKYGGNPDVSPFLLGLPAPPLNYEAGWKDTAIMHPGEVTRIVARFAPQDVPAGNTAGSFTFDPSPGGAYYVWHCHITDHEDNEMMRPFQIQSSNVARSYEYGIDY